MPVSVAASDAACLGLYPDLDLERRVSSQLSPADSMASSYSGRPLRPCSQPCRRPVCLCLVLCVPLFSPAASTLTRDNSAHPGLSFGLSAPQNTLALSHRRSIRRPAFIVLTHVSQSTLLLLLALCALQAPCLGVVAVLIVDECGVPRPISQSWLIDGSDREERGGGGLSRTVTVRACVITCPKRHIRPTTMLLATY